MTIRALDFQIFMHNIQTRMPFRYGIAEMTAVPHLFLQIEYEVDGQKSNGVAADNLIPKWFTKDPETSYEDDLRDMWRVIRQAGEFAVQVGAVESVFDLWLQVYQAQQAWASEHGYPPLLWNFGVSLVERALIDAYCRVKGLTFPAAVQSNDLGIRLSDIHPVLESYLPAELLPAHPLQEIHIRHTVGLSDYISEAEIEEDQRLNDGLPQSLEANIRAYGIQYFKIKINGNVEQDAERLCRIDTVLSECGINDYFFTLDGNEQYQSVAEFKWFWEQITNETSCSPHMARLLFVEQPFHRDVALSEGTRKDLIDWKDRPLIIIDESDAELESMQTALKSGYAGTSHKNCKGIFKSLANACLLQFFREKEPHRKLILSGEDLANIGPVALLQDLVVMAVLGIQNVERNGHHYFPGLSVFPLGVQQLILAEHPDLYHQPKNFPALDIRKGKISISSLLQAPFGSNTKFPLEKWFTPDSTWNFESLHL
ncbi:MAG: hypothetical protein PVJ21_19415 [Anaerolineales bacterium]|jgi:hypothetical protein